MLVLGLLLDNAGILGMDILSQKLVSATGKKVDLVAVMGGEPDVMFRRAITEMGGIKNFIKPGQKVVVKPNIGWDKAPELASNTNPKLIGEIVKQCFAAGAKEVTVFDHTCDDWQKCYKNSGIEAEVKAAGGKLVPAHLESYYRPVSLPHDILFIGEIYNSAEYNDYIFKGKFDYLYDKVGLYDTLKDVICGQGSATAITQSWQSLGGLEKYMAQQEEKVGTYNEFREKILPRIAKAGYNCIQIMALQEHPYYGSFGYHENEKALRRVSSIEPLVVKDCSDIPDANHLIADILKNNVGKVIIVDLWATWCSPCLMALKEMRHLELPLKSEELAHGLSVSLLPKEYHIMK